MPLINPSSGTPTGTVSYFAANAAPLGWIKANGATLNRATFAALFSAIGTTYGAGDGATTFVLPELRGEFLRSLDDGRGVDAGRSVGTFQDSENKSHAHSLPHFQVSRYTVGDGDVDGSRVATGYDKVTLDQPTNNSGFNEARPRNIAMLACIKF